MSIKRLLILSNLVCFGSILAITIMLLLSVQPRLANAASPRYIQHDGVESVITNPDGEQVYDVRTWNETVAEIGKKGMMEEIFNPTNGHYYSLVVSQESPLNWFEAKVAAESLELKGVSGHLATVTSQQEEDFIVSNFPEIYPQYVWLGASDEASEDDWKWISGEAWDYTDWAIGEPNGETYENCLEYGDYQQWWNDASCYDHETYFYLVEFPVSYVYLPLVTR